MNKIMRGITFSVIGLALALPARAEGDFTESLVLANGEQKVLESGSYGSISGNGTIVARGNIACGLIAPTVNLVVEEGVTVSSLYTDSYVQEILRKSALWLDASQDSSMKEYTYNGHTVPEGTFPGIVVRRWSDCRKQELSDAYNYALNAREDGFIRVMPYTVTNALNGRTVVSFGTYPGTHLNNNDPHNQIDSSGKPTGNGYDEQRRLIFSKPVSCATAIMVFGSQNAGPENAPVGGGTALLGGWTQSTNSESKNLESGEFVDMVGDTKAPFPRNSTTAKILDENLPCWVDGEQVNPKETDLNGSYQIISLSPNEARDVRSLGMKFSGANAGGQIYGEVLIFTNKLASSERVAVELYLAKKWGLQSCYINKNRPRSVVLCDGATYEAQEASVVEVSGSGRVIVNGEATATGLFAGDVTVAEGATLKISLGKRIWTDGDVAKIAGRVAWFDPECADDLLLSDPSYVQKNRIHALFDHGNKDVEKTPYLHGFYRDNTNDRRPLLKTESRGAGPIRNWMDLNDDDNSYPVKGNNFRIKTDHTKAKGDDSSSTTLAVKTAFIVQDSVYGGGSPIIDKNTPGSSGAVVGARAYTNPASPIWGTGTGAILTQGETRLNGATVDGTTSGFTGAPELFSFTTDGTAALNAGFLGYYNAGPDKAYEVLGEVLLFNDVLSGETRDEIEAYLMKKWLGRVPAGKGYDDWTQAAFTGPGTVAVEAETLTFRLDGATTTVDNAINVEGTLKLPEAGALELAFTDGKVKNGTYTLATFGSLVGADWTKWTLPTTVGGRTCKIKVTEHAITATISSGFMMLLY